MATASSQALESAPAVTTELSVYRGLDAPGAGGTDLHSSGPPGSSSILAALCPPGLCLSGGGVRSAGSWAMSPDSLSSGACAAAIVLPGPCSSLPGSLCLSPSGLLPGRAAPSVQSLRSSPSELLLGSALRHCSPLGSSAATGCGALPRAQALC